jgi:nucleoside phosphorylase
LGSLYNISKVINIGIAGSNDKSLEIGKLFIANKIYDFCSNSIYYLQPKITTALPFATILSSQEPVTKLPKNSKAKLVDMESYGICKASTKFLTKDNIIILKVVSDYLDNTILSKISIKNIMSQYTDTFIKIIKEQS